MNNILLTGATGVVGSEILRELLRDKNNLIFILIRANSSEELEEKITNLYEYLNIRSSIEVLSKIKPICGDICSANLGLNTQDFNLLKESVTYIIHSAANVKMNQKIEIARSNALAGTVNVLEFGLLCSKIKKFSYVSTVGVNGKSAKVLLEEPPPRDVVYHNTYEQAKAEAEFYLFDKVYKRIPIVIFRPSMVVGNSLSGAIYADQIFYHICKYLINGDHLGFSPYLDQFKLDTIPVNYLSEFVVKASLDDKIINGVFNICSGHENAISLEMIRNIILSKYVENNLKIPNVRHIPVNLYILLLKVAVHFMNEKHRKSSLSLGIFLEYLKRSPRFSNCEYMNLAKRYDLIIHTPKEYLPSVLDNIISRNKFNIM